MRAIVVQRRYAIERFDELRRRSGSGLRLFLAHYRFISRAACVFHQWLRPILCDPQQLPSLFYPVQMS